MAQKHLQLMKPQNGFQKTSEVRWPIGFGMGMPVPLCIHFAGKISQFLPSNFWFILLDLWHFFSCKIFLFTDSRSSEWVHFQVK